MAVVRSLVASSAVLLCGCLDGPPAPAGNPSDGGGQLTDGGRAGDDGTPGDGDGGSSAMFHSVLLVGNSSAGLAVPLTSGAMELPTDVGSPSNGTGDFTVELWFRGSGVAFPSGPGCTNNPGDIFDGMLLVDRDMLGSGDNGDWVITVFANKIQFGMGNDSWGRAVCIDMTASEWDPQSWMYLAAVKGGDELRLAFHQPSTDVSAFEVSSPADVPSNIDLSYDEGRLAGETDMRNAELRLGGGKWVGTSPAPNVPCGSNCVGFTGYLDEVRLSNDALYASAPAPTEPFQVDSATVALYRFESNSTTDGAIEDVSPSGVDGTLTGTFVWTEESAFD